MKNQKGFVPAIIILVVLVGLISFSVFYFLDTLKSKTDTITPTPKSSSVDPTSNCKTNTDCETESCGCTPKNKNYIDQNRNICAVICNKPQCVDNVCVISK